LVAAASAACNQRWAELNCAGSNRIACNTELRPMLRRLRYPGEDDVYEKLLLDGLRL